MLRTTFHVCLFLMIALGGGIWSVHYALNHFGGFDELRVGQWSAHPISGTADADPYAKARGARNGTLSLGVAEGLIFYASHSASGAPLLADCTYELSGPTPSARFWTIYAASPDLKTLDPGIGFEPALQSRNVLREPDGEFKLTISPTAHPGNWLAIKDRGPFVVVMRFYDTPVASSSGLSDLVMPVITAQSGKGRCSG
ncbi:DUF1214 domain-containing protein [Paraburkholderia aspalathi]|nr:DUF1214 domain-containing protein [Paraburkholderia aspalathi]